MKKKLVNVKNSRLFAIILILILFILFFRLSFLQITESQQYLSDFPQHIEISKSGKGYSILYFLMNLIDKVTSSQIEYSIALSGLYSILILAPIYPIMRCICKIYHLGEKKSFSIACCLLFLSSIYIPILQPFYYKSGIVTQPWHNITYAGMRLFSVFTVYGLSEVINQEDQYKITIKDWLQISIPLAIATGIKPNFLIAFSWTLLIYLIYYVSKNRFSLKSIIYSIELGVTIFPALLILYLQSKVLYGNGDSRIILFSSNFFYGGFFVVFVKLIRGLSFPFLVLIHERKRLTQIEKFVYLQYFVSLIQVMSLSESGPRSADGNFYWTLYVAGFILFICVSGRFIKEYRASFSTESNLERGYQYTCVALIVFHFLSGIAYFTSISNGGHFLQ